MDAGQRKETVRYYPTFSTAITAARIHLHQYGEWVDPGRWQGVPTEGKPDLTTRELLTWGMSVPIWQQGHPESSGCHLSTNDYLLTTLQHQIKPSLPWADDHFEERVSRKPTNPGEAYQTWPWWRGQYDVTASTQGDDESKDDFRFTHTYQERFWPKQAGHVTDYPHYEDRQGIRYNYGDLDDLVNLLLRDPYTRQAYLPIFFPEDTGAVHEGRIPCTLGYQFMLRDAKLHLWYFIRSCDYVRHFRDDIYLACRLLLWVLDELQLRDEDTPRSWEDVVPGNLNMTICSLHYHKGDAHLVS